MFLLQQTFVKKNEKRGSEVKPIAEKVYVKPLFYGDKTITEN